MHVIVEAPTGVFYRQQYGGAVTRCGQVEGFLVPMSAPDALASLRQLFERGFCGAGAWGRAWSFGELRQLREAVGGIVYWACDENDERPHRLSLDESRMDDADEAWIPVITPDGPGVSVWSNSD